MVQNCPEYPLIQEHVPLRVQVPLTPQLTLAQLDRQVGKPVVGTH